MQNSYYRIFISINSLLELFVLVDNIERHVRVLSQLERYVGQLDDMNGHRYGRFGLVAAGEQTGQRQRVDVVLAAQRFDPLAKLNCHFFNVIVLFKCQQKY